MICSRPVPCCPECEDTLIHQEYRGSGELSSGLGQYVNDKLDNVMYWLDIDGVIYSKKTKMLRESNANIRVSSSKKASRSS